MMIVSSPSLDVAADPARSHVISIYPVLRGFRGRNSDNMRLLRVLGWEPQISLEDGLTRTYAWIEEQLARALAQPEAAAAIAEAAGAD